MRTSLNKEILSAAAKWSDDNEIPRDKAKRLLSELNEVLDRLGLIAPPGRGSKEQKKNWICNIIATTESCSIRKIQKIMGYRGERSVALRLDELKVEGRVSYDKEKGWSVNESQD